MRELSDTEIHGTAAVVGAPDRSFEAFTSGPGDDAGVFGARVDAEESGFNLFADYQAEARADLFGRRFPVGLRIDFRCDPGRGRGRKTWARAVRKTKLLSEKRIITCLC